MPIRLALPEDVLTAGQSLALSAVRESLRW
jgi:hypothetical protein